LTDVGLANAFLLGVDLRGLCTMDELAVVHEFIKTIRDEASPAWPAIVRAAYATQRDEDLARAQVDAFEAGLRSME